MALTFSKEVMERMLETSTNELLFGDHTTAAATETSMSELTPEILKEMKKLASEPVLIPDDIISGTLPELQHSADALKYVMPKYEDFVIIDDHTAEITPKRVGEARKKFYEEQDDAGAF